MVIAGKILVIIGPQHADMPPARPLLDRDKSASSDPACNNTRQPQQQSSNFFWIDSQGGKDIGESHREKHAFIKLRRHRLQKEKKLQALKMSIKHFPCVPDSRLNVELVKDVTQLKRVQYVPTVVQPAYLDPFSTLTTQMTWEMKYYFHHYRAHCSRSCYPFAPTDMARWWWKKALDQPALVYILLSNSATHLASIKHAPLQLTENATIQSLQFRSNSIKSLLNILHHSSRDELERVVLVITNLICVEGAEANHEATEAHVTGLRKVIHLLCGFDNISHLHISAIYCGDYMRGLSGLSPAFPMSTKWRNSVLDLISQTYRLNDHGSFGIRFFTSRWTPLIQPTLKALLLTFQQIAWRYELILRKTQVSSEIGCDFLLLWAHQLLSLKCESSMTNFQSTLRLALLVYSAIRIWDLQGLQCVDVLVDMLRHNLDCTLSFLQITAPDLLVWILFLGSLASHGRENHQWFVNTLAHTAADLSLNDWDGLLSVLEGFCFTNRSTDVACKDIWSNAIRVMHYALSHPDIR